MIPVEGHKHLYREESGAIVNTDTNGYVNYMKAKNKQLEAQAELAKAQAQSTASAQKQKAMAQMGQAFQGYFS